ncbi:MAG: hypothetical protein PVI23_13375 [Maricaulaceae bacterium]|jgi:hypothetical protein
MNDARLALAVISALFVLAMVLLFSGAFDQMPDGQAAFAATLFAASAGFAGLIFASSYQAQNQTAENKRIDLERRRGIAIALWIDADIAVAELIALRNELLVLEQGAPIADDHSGMLKERAAIAISRARERLHSNVERMGALPDGVVNRFSRAAFGAAVLESNFSTIEVAAKEFSRPVLESILQPTEEIICELAEAENALAVYTERELGDSKERDRVLRTIKEHRSTRPFED